MAVCFNPVLNKCLNIKPETIVPIVQIENQSDEHDKEVIGFNLLNRS